MNIKRILKHLLSPDIAVRSKFSSSVMKSIETCVEDSEKLHCGEIRFAVENALDFLPLLKNVSARERAIEVFSDLRIWDTEKNNGVLIYLLFADHDVEIIADRGINHLVPEDEWERICKDMEACFRKGLFEQGVKTGISEITRHLAMHFPYSDDDHNELPNKPVLL
jgi:uncharacterized membrane protein